MNRDKVYLKGHVVGRVADTLGYQGLMVQLENLDIVEIDKNLVHKEIGEPQKPVIPQFVAGWIEEAKKSCKDVAELFDFDFTNDEVRKWFMQERPFDLVARAWLDGYEVEKEKKYKVKFKNIQSGTRYLKYDGVIEKWYFGINQNSSAIRLRHTKEELEEAGFGWVFDCPGIEIEEVEE